MLYDGICNFCNASVQFILKRDPAGYFSFAAQQSDYGEKLMREYGIDPASEDTLILIEDGKVFTRSDAALRIAGKLSGPWRFLSLLTAVPRSLRNGIYTFIARNRYRWFGRKDSCPIPEPEWRQRFLDAE